MKKTLLFLTIYLMIFQTTILLGSTHKKQASFETKINGVTFCIDKRIELFYIVAILADYPRINGNNATYKNDIKEYFTPYLQHEIISFIKEIGRKWYLNTPTQLMLYFTEDFKLRTDAKLPEDLITICGGIQKIERYQELLRDFAIKSNYHAFLDAHANFYNTIISTVNYNFRDYDEIKRMENYYKQKQLKYTIILNLLGIGNFGPNIQTSKGTEIYAIIQPEDQFGDTPFLSDNWKFNNLIWHEFGHSFVNKLTDKYLDLVMKYSNLQEPIKEQMKKQAYDYWPIIVNEHVIRAVTVKLAEAKYGSDIAANIKQKEIAQSFYYITPICRQLDIYIQNRDKYKTFSEFYPTLIESAFDEALKINYTDIYLKNLNSTYSGVDFIVVSEDEGEKNIQNEVYSYVEGIKNKLFKNIPLITDKEALRKDLSKYSFVVYGTVRNNLLIQKFQKEMPIVVSDTYIYTDKQYNTSDGKVIFNMQNPLNPKKTIVFYIAQKPSGIIGINNVFHGGTNYVVFENSEKIYKAGFVEKENNKWICK